MPLWEKVCINTYMYTRTEWNDFMCLISYVGNPKPSPRGKVVVKLDTCSFPCSFVLSSNFKIQLRFGWDSMLASCEWILIKFCENYEIHCKLFQTYGFWRTTFNPYNWPIESVYQQTAIISHKLSSFCHTESHASFFKFAF